MHIYAGLYVVFLLLLLVGPKLLLVKVAVKFTKPQIGLLYFVYLATQQHLLVHLYHLHRHVTNGQNMEQLGRLLEFVHHLYSLGVQLFGV